MLGVGSIDFVLYMLYQNYEFEWLTKHLQLRRNHVCCFGIGTRKPIQKSVCCLRNSFETGIQETIRWYLDHKEWWTRIQSGAYQNYYAKQYGERLGGDLA